jgi:hypothetical protein
MQDFEKLGSFYLGANVQDKTDLLYDSKDLVTHAVCVGMTGSGKTGLCISLLEEAAIDGIPAILIDPKGDLGNLLLQFPELRPEDFRPWINEEDARLEGVSPEEFAGKQASLWAKGLAKWRQDGARIARLRDSADFAIYTPGSSAGLELSIVKSFSAPAELLDDRELLRDRVSTTATALLSLLGIDADPVNSREHVLLSNILDVSWRNGEDLDLAKIIHLVQEPPFSKIGVLDLNSFYPSGDRFKLAMALNNLLASPGFEAWLHGDALDVGRLLRTPEGKPRISILSIGHLSDTERMFFVSLLLNEVLAWTRKQSGTTSLRAILYMDEIFGYLPPVANPPSKKPLLTLLKQARAFGVGLVLATQNPVDLDYKALANCGTWFIGRLQTERDKNRLMDGLESTSAERGGGFDRAQMDALLSSLAKRVFLLNNVHDAMPVLFETRWALSYLRGPLTRNQIKQLMDAKKAQGSNAGAGAGSETKHLRTVFPAARVVLPPDIPQRFLAVRGSHADTLYRPMLLAVVETRYTDTKSKVDQPETKTLMTPINDDAIPVEWTESFEIELDPNELQSQPDEGIGFATLAPTAAKAKSYTQWNKDLVNWVFGNQSLTIYKSPLLKVCSAPGESEGDFRARIQHTAHEERDAQIEKLKAKYAPKVATLTERLRRAEQARQREQEQASQQTMNTVLSVGTGLLGALFGRKTLTKAAVTGVAGAARSVGRISKERGDVARAGETVEAVKAQMDELDAQFRAEAEKIAAATDVSQEALETVVIKPKKTGIQVRLFTLCWAPYCGDVRGWE